MNVVVRTLNSFTRSLFRGEISEKTKVYLTFVFLVFLISFLYNLSYQLSILTGFYVFVAFGKSFILRLRMYQIKEAVSGNEELLEIFEKDSII